MTHDIFNHQHVRYLSTTTVISPSGEEATSTTIQNHNNWTNITLPSVQPSMTRRIQWCPFHSCVHFWEGPPLLPQRPQQ